jgi:hypothetical protein
VNVGQIAKEWYEKNLPEGALAGVILRCFFAGNIIRRHDFLLMAETCWTDGKTIQMDRNPHNCWWIHFWTSEKPMSSYELCLEAPYPLEWVAFKRRGKIKILQWKKLYWKDFNLKKESIYGRSAVCSSTTTT